MEFFLNPDRERTNLTLVMALLVNGRTVLEDFSWSAEGRGFAKVLEEFGLSYSQQGHALVLTGKGFQYPVPSLLPIDFGERDSVLLWTLASRDTEQVFTFAAEEGEAGERAVNFARELLQKHFKIVQEGEEPCKFQFRFAPENQPTKKDSLGGVPYVGRIRLMLRSLIRGEFLSFEEKTVVRDQWTRMLQYFGVPLRYEGRGVEQLSEFERRLLMAQGKKVELLRARRFCRILCTDIAFCRGGCSEGKSPPHQERGTERKPHGGYHLSQAHGCKHRGGDSP